MSAFRKVFCERIATVRGAITDFKLQDLPFIPANLSHNKSARIIRNGLAVQCFNIFEDFVRGRTRELLDDISRSGVAFANLPSELQRATTVDVIQAIQFQIRFQDKSNHISFAQEHSDRVRSTKIGPLRLAEISFFHSGSNISKEQYRDALSAMSIKEPWTQLAGLCSRFGSLGLPAQDVFLSFAQRRHKAAHDPNATVSEGDLQQSLADAIGLAVGYDILATRGARLIAGLKAPPVAKITLIDDHTTIPLRFVKHANGRYGEIKEGAKRFTRTAIALAPIVAAAAVRSEKENGALVMFDASGVLVDWIV